MRIIVPFPAGQATDTIARLMGQSLLERLGQSFFIENRTGAGGNIGTESVVRATPDGYTLLLAGLSNAIPTRSNTRPVWRRRGAGSTISRWSSIFDEA